MTKKLSNDRTLMIGTNQIDEARKLKSWTKLPQKHQFVHPLLNEQYSINMKTIELATNQIINDMASMLAIKQEGIISKDIQMIVDNKLNRIDIDIAKEKDHLDAGILDDILSKKTRSEFTTFLEDQEKSVGKGTIPKSQLDQKHLFLAEISTKKSIIGRRMTTLLQFNKFTMEQARSWVLKGNAKALHKITTLNSTKSTRSKTKAETKKYVNSLINKLYLSASSNAVEHCPSYQLIRVRREIVFSNMTDTDHVNAIDKRGRPGTEKLRLTIDRALKNDKLEDLIKLFDLESITTFHGHNHEYIGAELERVLKDISKKFSVESDIKMNEEKSSENTAIDQLQANNSMHSAKMWNFKTMQEGRVNIIQNGKCNALRNSHDPKSYDHSLCDHFNWEFTL